MYFFISGERNKVGYVGREVFEKISQDNTDNILLYGVSFFKQLPVTEEIKKQYPNLTRPSIQKAVCILSKAPIFGRILDALQSEMRAYFAKNDFKDTEVVYCY